MSMWKNQCAFFRRHLLTWWFHLLDWHLGRNGDIEWPGYSPSQQLRLWKKQLALYQMLFESQQKKIGKSKCQTRSPNTCKKTSGKRKQKSKCKKDAKGDKNKEQKQNELSFSVVVFRVVFLKECNNNRNRNNSITIAKKANMKKTTCSLHFPLLFLLFQFIFFFAFC